jgi:acylphosphatase
MTIEKIRTIIIVHGNVQKAEYRGRVISIGKMMNLTGTVQNLSNGTVRIIVEGDRIDVDRFCEEIDIRNTLIRVSSIERGKNTEYVGEYDSFYKIVGEGEIDERLDTAAELLKELIYVTRGGFNNIGKKLEDLELITKNGFDKIGQR